MIMIVNNFIVYKLIIVIKQKTKLSKLN